MERLQKVMASAGVASRRASEVMIREGRVRVNGVVVSELGTRVDPAKDQIAVDGRQVAIGASRVYILLNKPAGYLSTARDERGRPTVLTLVPGETRVYPVGRLDADSEGLLLLTNDGELANLLTHPRFEHEKEYHVQVRGQPSSEALERLRHGLLLEDGLARADAVSLLDTDGRTSWLGVVLHEGRKRQVRRMCEAIGHPAVRLVRVRMGPLHLGDLPTGQYRYLSPPEVDLLKGIKSTIHDQAAHYSH